MQRFLLIILSVWLLASPALAIEPFVVANIAVDVTAETATAARDAAIIQAQRAAFNQLLTEQGAPSPTNLSDDAIAGLVRDFSIQTERSAGNRYTATYTFRFRTAPTRTALQKAGTATPSEPATITADNTAPQNLETPTAPAAVTDNAKEPDYTYVAPATAAGTLQDPRMAGGRIDTVTSSAPAAHAASGHAGKIIILASSQSPADIQQIRSLLLGAPQVQKTDYLSITRNGARLAVSYQGDISQLKQTLLMQKLYLVEPQQGTPEYQVRRIP